MRQPERNQYAYKLEGVDSDWIHTSSAHRRATYTLVPHGTHTFRVKAANDDGYWNEEGTSILVTILPPWWRTGAFKAGVLLGLAAVIFGAFRWRVYAVESRNRTLEALVDERTAELAESNQKLELASLTDPLTGMKNRRYLNSHIDVDVNRVLRLHRESAEFRGTGDNADLVFVLIDIDHFKDVNDEYGHDAGDRILIGMRDVLESVCRESDTVGALGRGRVSRVLLPDEPGGGLRPRRSGYDLRS